MLVFADLAHEFHVNRRLERSNCGPLPAPNGAMLLNQPSRFSVAANAATAALLTFFAAQAVAEETPPPPRGDSPAVDFASEIKPILADKCFFCHGPDADNREADLRLDVAPYLAEDDGGAIAPGDRESSNIWSRINDADDPMPPVYSHKALSPEEVELIGRWIDQGAKYEAHWAYAPVAKPAAPEVEDGGWGRGEIDRFLYTKMRQNSVQPAEDAAPARLLRRLYLDLTGLPPTPAQLEAYLSNPSDDAYAKAVETLMANPRFGEHWAAWWLDLVRYGDSVGFHGDQPHSVWPYREWVINAFNDNMPFDRFSRLQLAGDQLGNDEETAEDKNERLFASAYNRLNPVTAEGGAQQKEYRAIYAADRVSNFGEVWLASSTRCCQCHDHKYDPFTAADFYSLAAAFEDIDHPLIANVGANPSWMPYRFLPENDDQAAQIKELDERYEALLAKHPGAGVYESWIYSRDAGQAPPGGPWVKELKEITKQRNDLAKKIPHGLITRARPEPRPTRLLARGNWQDESGPLMTPRPPEFLQGADAAEMAYSRLDLANWLFEADNPLTARVVVNRLWSRFFGRGISSNTLDFGNQGDPPTHRDLLDWLATDFVESGWDMQHVMRRIVLSHAYRQSSEQSPKQLKSDPGNKWFARQSATRLPAEVLRDQALAASGLLVERLGGPSVFPYQPKRHWAALNFPRRGYPQSHGDDLYRRSVYTWVQRSFPHPAMTVFDAPNRESCTAKRPESNTPLQALSLLNETLSVEAARHLAARAMRESEDRDGRIQSMFKLVLLRAPSESERAKLAELHESMMTYFGANPESAKKLCRTGESEADRSLPPIELASYTSIGRVLFNLHETVTKP